MGDAALVNPGDASAALTLAQAHGVRPRWVLHTHGHADHTGGTDEVVRHLGAEVYGGGGDADWYPPDVDVAGGAELALGALRIQVHPVPGHTPGSVLYAWGGHLLTGDTLFWGGASHASSPPPRTTIPSESQRVSASRTTGRCARRNVPPGPGITSASISASDPEPLEISATTRHGIADGEQPCSAARAMAKPSSTLRTSAIRA